MSIDLSPIGRWLSDTDQLNILTYRLNNLLENIEVIGENRYLAVKEEVDDE